jgi:hypothetical protein
MIELLTAGESEVHDQPENRRHPSYRLFGIVDVNIPVVWLCTFLAGGLLHLGVVYNQFQNFREQITEIKTLLKIAVDSNGVSQQRNLLQDQILSEHERRLNQLEDILRQRRSAYTYPTGVLL